MVAWFQPTWKICSNLNHLSPNTSGGKKEQRIIETIKKERSLSCFLWIIYSFSPCPSSTEKLVFFLLERRLFGSFLPPFFIIWFLFLLAGISYISVLFQPSPQKKIWKKKATKQRKPIFVSCAKGTLARKAFAESKTSSPRIVEVVKQRWTVVIKKRHLQTNINKLYHFTQGFSPLVSLNTAGYSALISEGHETIIHQKFLVESEPIALLSMKYKFF